VDVYVAGFPRHPFSTAGKREGFQDTQGRGMIYSTMVSYIQHHSPTIFVLESCKGLTHHDQGKTLKRISQDLKNILYNNSEAYDIYQTVLNTTTMESFKTVHDGTV
jgi:DNA (cytosine-5)-methyltransferase 1